MFIDSYPDGFRIFLDGKNRLRTTPDSFTWLTTDSYEVTLKKQYYLDTTFTAEVIEGEKKSVFIDLSANPKMKGSLSITSRPEGAEIFINGSPFNKTTPLLIEGLLPGEYNITLEKVNHQNKRVTTIIRSSSLTKEFLSLIDTVNWKIYNIDNSVIPTNIFSTVYVDETDVVWLGSRIGLIKYENNIWTTYDPVNSELPGEIITSIDVDSKNSKWISTTNGIAQIEPSGFMKAWGTKYTGFPTDSINSITILKGGEYDSYLFATAEGLGKYIFQRDPLIMAYGWEFSYYGNLTAVTSSDDSKQFYNSELIMGFKSNGILVTHLLQSIQFTKSNSGIPGNAISCLKKSDEGIWIGFVPGGQNNGGIALYKDKKIISGFGLNLPSPEVHTIYIDKNNRKWIGTSIGVFTFDNFNDRVLLNEETTGLPLNSVVGIHEDSIGRIWMATEEYGLYVLNDPTIYF